MITISQLQSVLIYIGAFGLSGILISKLKINKIYYYLAILLIAYILYNIQKNQEDKNKVIFN